MTKTLLSFFAIILLSALILLTNGTTISLSEHSSQEPKLDIKEYFSGDLKAWGIVQDWRGNVTARFDADINGEWHSNDGILKEQYRYYNGDVQNREWRIIKQTDGTYIGYAEGVINRASGEASGSSANWQYSIDVPVDGSTHRIKFDNWMWQMHDGVIVNRSYLKKFGITVAEITVFVQKQ
ncbi:DUF3833 domain-containing protein [Rickettsiaceae bacterium]|nr:DUF3833 domain-containing protein [Rickettsiaceae bacterium]